MIDPETSTGLEEFHGQVRGLVIELSDVLSHAAVENADLLVRHGEIGDGLVVLAWAIVEEDRRVPRHVIRRIVEWSDGLVPEDHLPKGLEAHILE